MAAILCLSCSQQEIKEENGMIYIPGGTVDLGPRILSSVPGWEPPANPTGVTPGNGQGKHQRAAGAPPMHVSKGKGVGHVRPGSGMPSAPPNMPGSQAKSVGKEENWTANPSMNQKIKSISLSAFWIDKTEVTRSQYKVFLDETGYKPPFVDEKWAEDGWNWDGTTPPKGTEDHPVVMINWYDAQEYCRWQGKDLPTEAQWQLAALGDASLGYLYPWGKNYNHDASNHGQIQSPNFDDSDGYLYTSPVGSFPAGNSPFGLQDSFGNAWEFTRDSRRASWKFYNNLNQLTDVYAPGPSLYVAVRGGSYFFDMRPNPGGERNEFLNEIRRKTSGFRCAR